MFQVFYSINIIIFLQETTKCYFADFSVKSGVLPVLKSPES